VTDPSTGTISIINGTNVSEIHVGGSPDNIVVNSFDNIAYVVGSDSTHIISGTNQAVQAGVSFDINPFHGGYIECNDIVVPANRIFYVDFRTQCTAQPNQGFQFSSWIENSEGNSSRTISASQGDWFTRTLDWRLMRFACIMLLQKYRSY
jgi:hypothetical protein